MKEIRNCKIVQDLLPNYIDGLTNEETNVFIENHLKECSECKKTFENILICPCSFNTKDKKTTCSKCGNCFFNSSIIFEKIH